MVWNVIAQIGAAVIGGVAQNRATKKQNALNQAAMDQQNAFNKQAYEKERQIFSDRFIEIRNDAEKGGFNPLTALKLGALAAYGNPSLLPKQAIAQQAQTSVALQAAQAGLQAWAQAPALAREKERFELENQLIRENILSSQAQRKMLNTTSVFGSALATTKTGVEEKERTAVTTPFGTTRPANVSDAEKAEQRWGDIIQEIIGASTFVSDMYSTGVLTAADFAEEKNIPFGLNNPQRPKLVRPRPQYKGSQSPNYRDRFGIGGSYYNY